MAFFTLLSSALFVPFSFADNTRIELVGKFRGKEVWDHLKQTPCIQVLL